MRLPRLQKSTHSIYLLWDEHISSYCNLSIVSNAARDRRLAHRQYSAACPKGNTLPLAERRRLSDRDNQESMTVLLALSCVECYLMYSPAGCPASHAAVRNAPAITSCPVKAGGSATARTAAAPLTKSKHFAPRGGVRDGHSLPGTCTLENTYHIISYHINHQQESEAGVNK
jgi:hypothetical protein